MSIVQMFNSSFLIMETAKITQQPEKRIKFNEKNEPKEILLKLLQFSKIPDIEIIDIEISVENQIYHMNYDEKIDFVRIFEQQKFEQYKPLPIPKKFDYIKIIEKYANTSQKITITTYDLLNFDCILTDEKSPIKLHYQMGILEHNDKTDFRFKIMDDSSKINLELTKSDTDLKISSDQILKTFDGIPTALKSKLDDKKYSKFKKLFSGFSTNKKSEKEIPKLKGFAFIYAKDSFSIELEIEELLVTLFLSPKKISFQFSNNSGKKLFILSNYSVLLNSLIKNQPMKENELSQQLHKQFFQLMVIYVIFTISYLGDQNINNYTIQFYLNNYQELFKLSTPKPPLTNIEIIIPNIQISESNKLEDMYYEKIDELLTKKGKNFQTIDGYDANNDITVSFWCN